MLILLILFLNFNKISNHIKIIINLFKKTIGKILIIN